MLNRLAWRFFRSLGYGLLSFLLIYVADFLQTKMVLGPELTPLVFALLMSADKLVRLRHEAH